MFLDSGHLVAATVPPSARPPWLPLENTHSRTGNHRSARKSGHRQAFPSLKWGRRPPSDGCGMVAHNAACVVAGGRLLPCVLPRRCFGLRVLRRQPGAAPHFSQASPFATVPIARSSLPPTRTWPRPPRPVLWAAPCRPKPSGMAIATKQSQGGMCICGMIHPWYPGESATPVHGKTIRERQRASVVCVFHLEVRVSQEGGGVESIDGAKS